MLFGNAIILYGQSVWLDWARFITVVTFVFVLPGWVWLTVWGWFRTMQALERLVLIIGLSSLLSALALLLTLFLPGPFTETPVLIALNLIIGIGLIFQLVKFQKSKIPTLISHIEWPSRTVLIILLIILAVAAFTRLTRLGYAEFHEDELENMRLIVRAYKGEEYAPFLDSKGPIHWLLPTALWYLNGWVNEGIARTPFAIASLALIPLIYVLGKRLTERESVGLIAAGLVGLNGFYVAYARFIENQSLIVFWGALAVWFAYRYYDERCGNFLIFVAFSLSMGLIAHPDVLLYLPLFIYIIAICVWQRRDAWRQQILWIVGASLLFVGLTALFYIPYLFDPKIGLIYQYFADERIGEGLFYNQIANLFDQDQLYTTRYHAPLLALLLWWLLWRQFSQWLWPGRLILGGLTIIVISTVVWPDIWLLGALNAAFVPYVLLTLLLIALPQTPVETKMIFLWFIAPLGALLFLAKDAADHIQIAYTGWALLSAMALVDLWTALGESTALQSATRSPAMTGQALGLVSPQQSPQIFQAARIFIAVTLTIIIGLILFYQYLAFNAPVTTYWQAKIASANNPNSIYNRLYGSLPRPRKIFSNPRLSGWKVVGYLWATGALTGDFRSINESFATPIWYTFQTPRSCYEDPQNYWVRRSWDGWPDEEQEIIEQGYVLTHVVRVDQDPKLHLYEKKAVVDQPQIIDVNIYRQAFDHLATPARFAQEESGQQSTTLNFDGDRLRLIGYDFPMTALEPGDLLLVTVYWEALAPMEIRYRAFMHLVDGNGTLWGQHDDDPACRLLTTEMRPGQRSSRQFRLPVDSAAPSGDYTIIFGLYNPDTLERIEIWDAGIEQPVGDQIILGRLRIN